MKTRLFNESKKFKELLKAAIKQEQINKWQAIEQINTTEHTQMLNVSVFRRMPYRG